jgi:mannose-6-phosphate isomerase-like protein (cupin superfamily)
MPHIAADDAPTFQLPGTTFIGLAAPSRGSTENAVWRVRLAPGTPARPHQLTREEVFVVTAGSAVASVAGAEVRLGCGDSLVVPAFTDFSLANPSSDVFEAVVVLPVGARAMLEDGVLFAPPWSL